jgi:hypothetical protein
LYLESQKNKKDEKKPDAKVGFFDGAINKLKTKFFGNESEETDNKPIKPEEDEETPSIKL